MHFHYTTNTASFKRFFCYIHYTSENSPLSRNQKPPPPAPKEQHPEPCLHNGRYVDPYMAQLPPRPHGAAGLQKAHTRPPVGGVGQRAISAFGALFFGKISDKKGGKEAIFISLAILIASVTGLLFIKDVIWFYVIGFIASFSLSSAQAVSLSMMSQLAPVEQSADFFRVSVRCGKNLDFRRSVGIQHHFVPYAQLVSCPQSIHFCPSSKNIRISRINSFVSASPISANTCDMPRSIAFRSKPAGSGANPCLVHSGTGGCISPWESPRECIFTGTRAHKQRYFAMNTFVIPVDIHIEG